MKGLTAIAAMTAALSAAAATAAPPANVVAQAKARIAQIAHASDAAGKPRSAPAWRRGENVWVIACDDGIGCQAPAHSLQEAGHLLGWKVTDFNGQANPAEYTKGVDEAIADNADAIVLSSVDCRFIRAPLERARQAGIVIVGWDSLDCSDPSGGGGEALLDYDMMRAFRGSPGLVGFIENWGRYKTDYVIARTNGHAMVIVFSESDIASMVYQGDAIKAELARCHECKIVADIEYTLPELFNQGLQKKFETALAEHPEADAVVTLYDGAILYAIAPVLQQVHRTNMLVAGGEGYPDSLDLIRAGKGQSCAFAVAVAESGYPIADELIRLFAHKPPVGEGIGLALIDNQHNLSRTQKFYDGFFPYAAYYTRLWHRAGER